MSRVPSYRDPENFAVPIDGQWFRICAPRAAAALEKLRTSDLYTSLTADGAILDFEPVLNEVRTRVLANPRSRVRKFDEATWQVYRIPTVPLITYPWEWPNAVLAEAGIHTLRLREQLLEIGLDLKDAAASNIQFRGMRPFLLDIGSIEPWVPNPSWNALKQYVENFINPLAVGRRRHISAADVWRLNPSGGLPSPVARELMAPRHRANLGLAVLQWSTIPREGRKPAEVRYQQTAQTNPSSALKATRSLTRRLQKQTRKLSPPRQRTTWADYGSRDHYTSDGLRDKVRLAQDFVREHADGSGPVLDVGGNDGMTAITLARETDPSIVVLEPDSGALNHLTQDLLADQQLASRIQVLRGDLTNPVSSGGLLGEEFRSLFERVRPSATLCQAVLHHVVITQGIPIELAIRSLANFSAPLQVEFAGEDDPKVKLLVSQIPHWKGEYNQESLIKALERHYECVEIAGHSTATRIVVNAWKPRLDQTT